MAGSLKHIIAPDGTLTMDKIDNLGDAHEALEELYALVIDLSDGDMRKVSAACLANRFPDPYEERRYKDDPMPMAMKKGYSAE